MVSPNISSITEYYKIMLKFLFKIAFVKADGLPNHLRNILNINSFWKISRGATIIEFWKQTSLYSFK